MNDLTRAFLADTRSVARDQIERIFDERLTALSAGVVQAVAESLAGARRDLTSKLNQAVRRLRAALEAKSSGARRSSTRRRASLIVPLCSFCAMVRFTWPLRGIFPTRTSAWPSPSIRRPLFESAAQSKDTVVALRTKGEMSEPLARWAGEDTVRKFYLFPITAHGRVVALLYADATEQDVETNGLELLATVAGALIESRAFLERLAPTAGEHRGSGDQSGRSDLHLKAQRFARNQVAEIRLYKSENVKNGRAERDLYTSLKTEIDSARETFRRDFCPAPAP